MDNGGTACADGRPGRRVALRSLLAASGLVALRAALFAVSVAARPPDAGSRSTREASATRGGGSSDPLLPLPTPVTRRRRNLRYNRGVRGHFVSHSTSRRTSLLEGGSDHSPHFSLRRQGSPMDATVVPVWSSAVIQRCGSSPCPAEGCEEQHLQRASLKAEGSHRPGGGSAAALMVRGALASEGHPLDTSTRSFMEPRIGCDLSGVRVHTNAASAQSADAVGALAYTVGRDIVFGVDQYAPGTDTGKRMLAHELIHVVQQSAGAVDGTPGPEGVHLSDPHDRFEREADVLASRVVQDGALPATSGAAGHLPLQSQASGAGPL